MSTEALSDTRAEPMLSQSGRVWLYRTVLVVAL